MLRVELAPFVGEPVDLTQLKVRPGRRQTLRARGPRGSVIVKLYASNRAPVVAKRLMALVAGPPEPVMPRVVRLDAERHMLVLSEVPGIPLREAVVAGDLRACQRAGAALARWHGAWSGRIPAALSDHTAEREHEILERRAAGASATIADAVRAAATSLRDEWTSTTVVHRDLYEEQLLIDERVGLIDLDDAAGGPPELDVGNLLAHLDVLGMRRRLALAAPIQALLDGYSTTGRLDAALLEQCRLLSLLRLACLNDDRRLVDLVRGGAVPA